MKMAIYNSLPDDSPPIGEQIENVGDSRGHPAAALVVEFVKSWVNKKLGYLHPKLIGYMYYSFPAICTKYNAINSFV